MSYILLILIILILGLLAYPSFISCCMFAFCVLLAFIGTFTWNVEKVLSVKLILIIFVGLSSFIIGEIVARESTKTNKKNDNKENANKKVDIKVIKIDTWKLVLTIIGCILTAILLISEIKRICSFYGFESNSLPKILSFYRTKIGLFSTALIDDGIDINFIVKQMKKVCDVSCIIFMYIVANNILAKDKMKNIIVYCIPMTLTLFMTLLGSGRSIMMHMLVGFIMVYLIIFRNQNHKFTKKHIAIMISILFLSLLLFYLILPLVGRSTKDNFFEYITFYLGTPIPSFNYFLAHTPIHDHYIGNETFSNLYYVLNKINLIDYVKIGSHEWINGSNVYTSFRRYYFDFGIIGVMLCQFIFGFVSSKIYLKIKDLKNIPLLIIYGYFAYILIDQIRDEQFFGLFSLATFAYVILILLLYWIYFKFDIKKIKFRKEQ